MVEPLVHKRNFQQITPEMKSTFYYMPSWPNAGPVTESFQRRDPMYTEQNTFSQSHGWPNTKGTAGDIGGDFTTSKIKSFSYDRMYGKTPMRYGQGYEGYWFPGNPLDFCKSVLLQAQPASEYSLIQLGATAVSRCIPTSPVVDGTTALGELVTGLPQIPAKALVKSKFKESREYGSEYLNMQFGWLPLVSDIKKLGKAVQQSEKIMDQFYRDSGRLIRRRYEFPTETVTDSWTYNANYGWVPSGTALSTYAYRGSGQGKSIRTVSTRTWFSGAFTYYAPSGVGYPANVKKWSAEARRLYGIELTPEVVWNLTPFSWLTDWFANTGDVLKNVSRFSQDGLVMPYGYIMQERTVSVETTVTNGGIDIPSNRGQPYSMRATAVSKVRRRANPFGFGVSFDSLTGRQSAILAALGISRRR